MSRHSLSLSHSNDTGDGTTASIGTEGVDTADEVGQELFLSSPTSRSSPPTGSTATPNNSGISSSPRQHRYKQQQQLQQQQQEQQNWRQTQRVHSPRQQSSMDLPKPSTTNRAGSKVVAAVAALERSPRKSSNNNNDNSNAGATHRKSNEDAFSSSSDGSDDEEEDEWDSNDDELEDDDGDSMDVDEEWQNRPSQLRKKQQNGTSGNNEDEERSEFDKALQSGQGIPSRGNLNTSAGVVAPTHPPLHTPPSRARQGDTASVVSRSSTTTMSTQQQQSQWSTARMQQQRQQQHQQQQQVPPSVRNEGGRYDDDPLSSGVLPDVLMNMRQRIEAMTLFDSDMMRLANGATADPSVMQETRESLKRSSQQSISAAVLVSLAHKRYERRRLAAMEIEKVVRSLVQQDELDRVRAILLLLSDDYVRSTSEDARKGGVVALAASAIGLKKAADTNMIAHECRDLILASVVHACQDHSQRVRYYATESLFNVIKVIPNLAVQHFFILFEILRSLYADVDVDVKSGAELLDKKLKEVIVGAMNSGQFTADACVPVFARFVYMHNKATKRLTLTWLQELTEKLIGAPILEFLHLFLTGIFDMVADPTIAIRQSALAFLQSVLPKLLDNHVVEEAIDDYQSAGVKVDFDKILQSLVTTMEHPDPLVRKISMYWVSKIVKAHIGGEKKNDANKNKNRVFEGPRGQHELSVAKSKDGGDVFQGVDDGGEEKQDVRRDSAGGSSMSAATISVRNALPHILPGILLSIGDTFHSKAGVKDAFLPDTTTHTLAEQTNACLQQAVRIDGTAYMHHLDSFIVALREELDSPGGVNARNPPAIERKPYRMDVKSDGTGIESQGWFRASKDTKEDDVDSMMMSRLCALHWIIVLYENVVPDALKADYASEFIIPVIHQLVDNPPERIIYKSLEVLAKITIPVAGELTGNSFPRSLSSNSLSGLVPSSPSWVETDKEELEGLFPMNDSSAGFALDILEKPKRLLKSRDREVFRSLIQLHAHNLHLIARLSKVIAYMCRMQPPEFVFLSFAVELDRFVRRESKVERKDGARHMGRVYQFVSAFIQQMCLVLLNSKETYVLREVLKDCIGVGKEANERDQRRSRLFHILLHSFAHNLVATTSLCFWAGACRTASLILKNIDPLDINLVFLMELDKLVEMMERPLFRHLHVRMLETDKDPLAEGSGTMLFKTLRLILMVIPQSACYNVLRDRLASTSRFRQSVIANNSDDDEENLSKLTEVFVSRVLKVRRMHCKTIWETIRAESLEYISISTKTADSKSSKAMPNDSGADRREWLGYASKDEEMEAREKYRDEKRHGNTLKIEVLNEGYEDLTSQSKSTAVTHFEENEQSTAATVVETADSLERLTNSGNENNVVEEAKEGYTETWKDFWSESTETK